MATRTLSNIQSDIWAIERTLDDAKASKGRVAALKAAHRKLYAEYVAALGVTA